MQTGDTGIIFFLTQLANLKICNRRFKCHDCGQQFVENPTNIVIPNKTKSLVDRLLLERISLAGVEATLHVSKWIGGISILTC